MKSAYAKRSKDPAESPSKKQGTEINIYFNESFVSFDECAFLLYLHVHRKSSIFLFCSLPGVKRKAPSAVDMLKKKSKVK